MMQIDPYASDNSVMILQFFVETGDHWLLVVAFAMLVIARALLILALRYLFEWKHEFFH